MLAPALLLISVTLRVWAQTPAPEPVPTSTMSGVYSTAQAGRGEETYMSFCVSCHPLAVNTGEPFKVVWGGRLVSDLFGAIKEKMPKNDPGSLTAQEVAQVIAYLMKMNDIPAGKTELSDDVEALKTMRIETPAMRQGKAGG